MSIDIVKTSIENKDVTQVDPLDLSSSSAYPTAVIEESKFGIINHTISYDIVSGVTNIATIPHGYNGVPKILVYGIDYEKGFTIPLPILIEGITFPYIRCRADATNVYIEIYNFNAFTLVFGVDFTVRNFTFKYFIFPSLVA